MQAAVITNDADQRRNARTNLLLSATASARGRTVPIRIRNVSECGALIEGAGLPMEGETLELKRGDLEICATVAWAAGNKRGVRFDRLVAVDSWTAGTLKVIDCTGLRDQRRVDAIQMAARNGSLTVAASDPPGSETDVAGLDGRLAEELGYIQRLLETMGDELVADPAVVHRHLRCLQTIDLASQILTHLASILRADDRGAEVSRIGMDDLRARLLRRAIR